jgi:hypothetical protein
LSWPASSFLLKSRAADGKGFQPKNVQPLTR